ncbi:MAG: serine/threonine-protein kinase, partial [Tepidimonas taiwanensis]|nr:serine/threonine-protein kinase [Tepidimonas taiwanensis]
MAKPSFWATFWRSDWFAAVVALVATGFIFAVTPFIERADRGMYDFGMEISGRKASDQIVVIAIDEASIKNIGRWPWPRDVHAKMIDILAQAKPKVIGFSVFLAEEQVDKGLSYLKRLKEQLAALGEPAPGSQAEALLKTITEGEEALAFDAKLAAAMGRAGNVVLASAFELGEPQGRPDAPLPDYVVKNAVPLAIGEKAQKALAIPLQAYGVVSAGVGHLNQTPDPDGKIRSDPMLVNYFGVAVPSMALLVAARSLNLTGKDVKYDNQAGLLSLGNLRIPTDDATRFRPYFYMGDRGPAYAPHDSYFDVLTGKIPPSKYSGKIVIIGATAAGIGTTFPVPVASQFTSADLLAHSTSSILQQHYIVEPIWAVAITFGMLLVAMVVLGLVMPRMSALKGAAIGLALLVLMIGLQLGMMRSAGIWVPMMFPVIALLLGYIVVVTKRFIFTEKGKEKADAESSESNRMLGLSFQGQGQLDMAFDKYRKVPFSDALMDNLYTLALDFERKRQFNKAQAVYEYMSTHDAEYKDIKAKLTRAKTMSETVIFGGTSAKGPGTSILANADGTIEKPMLGRYQVEKELGKGAMGIVSLGKDPKIGRLVAIKTMALAQEFDGEELDDARQRFFREAETAGRLQHPNIVTIYDAGEEHDLAYIAMELLKGQDLVPFCKPESLLPVEKVLSIVARVADALAYAHAQNIVHRDIKPANIMYEPEKDVVKAVSYTHL